MNKTLNRALIASGLTGIGILSLGVVPPEELEANKPQLEVVKSGNNLIIDWMAHPEVFYFMEGTDDLVGGNWITAKLLKDNDASGTLSLGTAISGSKGFYRLELEGDPGSQRLREDSDGDRIINLLEAEADWDAYVTDTSADTDSDGIPDYFEQFHFSSLDHDGTYVAKTGGLTLAEAYANTTDPNKVDSDGDGWTDQQEIAWGWDPNYDQSRDDTKYGPGGDFDGDALINSEDAVPSDSEINWKRSSESRYVWLPQVDKTGAVAVSRHGHILFTADARFPQQTSEYLWDMRTSSYIDLPLSNSWAGGGLKIYNAPYDPDWLLIEDMNDNGSIIGSSQTYHIDSGVAFAEASLMLWEMTGADTTEYGDPTYLVPSSVYVDVDDDGETDVITEMFDGWPPAPRIADDGTVSCASLRFVSPVDQYAWVVKKTVAGVHCAEMDKWLSIDSPDLGLAAAMLDEQTGLFIQLDTTNDVTILHYKDENSVESLAGLLPIGRTSVETDIGRTPAPEASTEGRVWFSASYGFSDNVFIEKRSGGSGVNRWHNPPTMGEGAIRLNAQGEAITESKVWRNGIYTPINDLVSKPDGSTLNITKLIDLASNGIILAEATEGGTTKTGLLLKMDVENLREEIITDAFEVSNKVTSQNLDVQASPSVGDPRTYRVKLPVDLGSSAKIRFDLYDEDGASVNRRRAGENGVLPISSKTENAVTFYATDNFRFVTWDTDDAHAGNQTINVKLGDTVRMTLVVDGNDLAHLELPVGLPPSESSTKAIRTVDTRFVKLKYGDIENQASSDMLIERMDRVFAQGTVRFNEIDKNTARGPVKNIFAIDGIASATGDLSLSWQYTDSNGSITPDSTVVSIPVGSNPGEIAQLIASAINAKVGNTVAVGYHTFYTGSKNIGHVVIDKGQEVVYFQAVVDSVPGTVVSVPPSDLLNDGDVNSIHTLALLAFNYGDGDPGTMDVFIVDEVSGAGGEGGRGMALPYYYTGSSSPIVGSYCIRLSASKNDEYDPFIAPHEAGHIVLDEEHPNLTSNLMRDGTYIETADAVGAHKRLSDGQIEDLRASSNPAASMLQQK